MNGRHFRRATLRVGLILSVWGLLPLVWLGTENDIGFWLALVSSLGIIWVFAALVGLFAALIPG